MKSKEQKHRFVVGNELVYLEEDEDYNNKEEDRWQLRKCGCSQKREPPYTLYWQLRLRSFVLITGNR